MQYKIIDRQGTSTFVDEVFNTKKEVIKRLADFHSGDWSDETYSSIEEWLSAMGDDNERLEELCTYGTWEVEEIDNKMLCPMCDTELAWRPTNPNYKNSEDTTHIYTCPKCPFIGFEFLTDKNYHELGQYLKIKK